LSMTVAATSPVLAHNSRRPIEPRPAEKAAPRAVAESEPFDAQEAARQVQTRMGAVRACYERASRREPGIEGKLRLGLEIGETGAVTWASVELDGLRAVVDPTATSELATCVRNQALRWRLAPEGPVGGVHLSYVFVFASSH